MTDKAIKSKDQLKLPGTYNAQEQRLEDIEDEILDNEGKMGELRKENKALNDEAVALVRVMKLKGARVRKGEEWGLKKGEEKYTHKRIKVKRQTEQAVEEAEKEEEGEKKAKESA